ncbi:hypothetical protein O3G_MSEX001987 [Manduca sexta]|uniref:HTH psq-type domain-containing protein n=1 Tax=Manduca sexta TaxID=7130 RepID=A0A922CD24_MANSE|nr:hypothetical protein O3G_MSEX001987 [Manduca sexta]KAG6441728.1 hypothetical protein O3G_MSEX001987 [Manduca sexta]
MPPKRATWSEESMRAVMEAVKNGQMSQNSAAKYHNIPRKTLWNHLISGSTVKKIGRKPVLNRKQENQLVSRLTDKNKISKLTSKLIRREAFVFCEERRLKHNFNRKTGLAGKDWLRPFLERHPEISIG